MQVTISGKHIEITDAIREHAEEKVSKLPRYYNNIVSTTVIIEGCAGRNQAVEVIVKAGNHQVFVGKEEGADTYACIDMAVHKVERQISKHKDKERNNKHISGGKGLEE